jgi:hypothetical protein
LIWFDHQEEDEKAIAGFKKMFESLTQTLPPTSFVVDVDLLAKRIKEVQEKMKQGDSSDASVRKLHPTNIPYTTLVVQAENDRYDLLFTQPTHQILESHPTRDMHPVTKEGISILRGQLRVFRQTPSYSLPLLRDVRNNTITPNDHPTDRFAVAFAHWALDPKTSTLKK